MPRSRTLLLSLMIPAFIMLACSCLGACSSVPDAGPFQFAASEYSTVFDTAIEVARESGQSPAFRDRRAGIIESEPRVVGSVLEPWRNTDDSIGRTLIATVGMQRRIIRFEFMGVGESLVDSPEAVPAADLFAVDTIPVDLTQIDGAVELRARVDLEQAYRVGQRHSTWSRRGDTTTVIPGVENTFWSPVGRDTAMERRLIARVRRLVGWSEPEA